MSLPYVNMRSVVKKIDSSYIFQCKDIASHLETVIFQVLHLTTLRTKYQFATGVLAAASALHHGRFVTEVLSLMSGLDREAALHSDPPPGVIPGFAASATTPPDPYTPPPPEDADVQAGEFDFEASYASFVSRFKRGENSTCSFLLEQSGERWSERMMSYWGTYKAAKNTPFLQQCRKIFALILVGCMTSDDISKSHPKLYSRVIAGTGATNMDEFSIFEEVVELGLQTWTVVETCYFEKSWAPLFGCTATLTRLEQEHTFLTTHAPWYMLDEVERVSTASDAPCTPAEFELRVKKLRTELHTHHTLCKQSSERLVVKKYLDSISAIHARVVERLSRSTTRVVPFAIKFDGTTGTGKSSITNMVLRDILRIQKEPHTDAYIAVVNTLANHMDTLTNATRGVIIDDLCNTLVAMAKVDENRFIIDLLNMMQTPVLKAALEDKGQTFCRATALVVSTNAPDLQAKYTSIEQSAVLRRFQFHIMITVKEGFQIDNGPGTLKMLDGSKMVEGMNTAAQEFVVRQWIPLERNPARATDEGHFVALTGKLNYSQLLQFLKPFILRHQALQNRIVEDMAEDEKEPLCEHGYTTKRRCDECKAIRAALTEEAGEWWRWKPRSPAPPAQPPEPAPDTSPILVCAHGLSVCHVCHPSEDIPYARPSRWGRFMLALVPTAPADAPEPSLVRLCKAMTNGRYEIEDTFVRAPKKLLTIIYGVVPISTMSLSYGVFALFGLGGVIATLTTTLIGLSTVYHISAATVGWVRGRVAGLTLAELRARMEVVVHRAMGFALMLVFAGLAAAACVHTARRLMGTAQDEEQEIVPPPPLKPAAPLPKEMTVSVTNVPPGGQPPVGETEVKLQVTVPPGTEFPTRHQVHHHVDTILQEEIERCADLHAEPPFELPLPTAGLDLVVQGQCSSSQVEPASLPDPVPRQNIWNKRDIITHQCVSPRLANMTAEQSLDRVARQLFLVDIYYASGKTVRTMALGVCTNHVVLPMHNFVRPNGEMSPIKEMIFSRADPKQDGTYRSKVAENCLVRMQGDAMLYQANIGGTMVDITSLFTEFESCPVPFPGLELRRDLETTEIVQSGMMLRPEHLASSQYGIQYPGYSYTRKEETFKGLCGAVILLASKLPRIVGVHTLGKGTFGAACHISKSGLLEALEKMRGQAVNGGIPVNCHNTTLHTPAGQEAAAVIGPLSGRAIFREAPDGAPVLAMGTLVNAIQVRSGSNLRVSPISGLVEQCCGEVRKHGPPETIGRITVEKAKLAELDGLTQLPPDWLKMAQTDMLEELVAIIEAGDMWPYIKPLSHRETVSGIVGSSFVRRVNVSTSAGFPYKGGKRPLLMEDPTPEQPECLVNTPEMEAEILALEDKMAAGERPCFGFKACHKDEAVKIGKKKTRVFEGAPYPLTFLTRKYFLPLTRVYYLAQLQSECSVGINASGDEWDKTARHLMEFNRRLLEGDWVHYDSSQAYQEIIAFFTILITLALKSGQYDERSIVIMWVIAEEIARHFTIMRTDVAQIDGSNASGNSITVIINNGTNGLRARASFYALCPPDVAAVPKMQYSTKTLAGVTLRPGTRNFAPLLPQLSGRFADYVRAIYYGDDFLMAPRPEIESWYTQPALAAWFEAQGKHMTGADKLPFTRDFTPSSEASFLKRSFRYDEETGHYMAPLVMDSIYKPLHVWPTKLPVLPAAHAAEIMGGAIRELFQHGRVEFEVRVPKLLEVAKACGADCYLADDCESYDAALAEWLDTYGPQPDSE